MRSLRDRAIEEYIHKHYPHSGILNYDDPNCDFTFYTAQQLQSVDEDWFPLCCYKDPKTGKAVYGGRKKVFHTYVEGETGSGKTTRFVMQSLLALSSLKAKPSFVIVDIHGEIIENTYNHLIQNGYQVKILNCDDPSRSDTYNPLSELAKECLSSLSIGNEAINKIRRIAEIIQPVESPRDPIWDRGARSYTNGCILDKFEDLIHGDLPEECMTIYNIIQNHYWLRSQLTTDYNTSDLFSIPHYKKKGPTALSTQKMISVTNNADKTKASYFGVVENHYDTFGQPSLYSLSSSNTINIRDLVEKPTAIVIQSGSTRIGDDLISLLMNEIYTYVVKLGKESKTKQLPRKIHCFLDEFANCNIADGPEYIRMLTTSRKFGMFWHMILQCDAQLDRKYDSNIGRIIRANSTEIFFGSHDYETEVRFAKSCGQKTIESLGSVFAQQDPHLDVVDLITPERLNLIEEGDIYIKSHRHPLTRTYIEAFYHCDEFVPVEDIDTVYPYNQSDYRQTYFSVEDIPPRLTPTEFKILGALMDGEKTVKELQGLSPDVDVQCILTAMRERKLVEIVSDYVAKAAINERQFALCVFRNQNGCYETKVPETNPQPSQNDVVEDQAWGSELLLDLSDWDIEENAGDTASETTLKTITEALSEDPSDDPLFDALEAHMQATGVRRVLEKIEKLTVVPEVLLAALRYLILPVEEKMETDASLPRNPHFLKFEILENFLMAHDFDTKWEWVSKMREECDYVISEKVFPECISEQFENALRELDNDLTMDSIREIKKIITDVQ